jgi:low temperature requirement protein LtrA
MSEHAESQERGLHAVLRGDDERVLPLELFFDLVFVLAITQCTALMAHEPDWTGLGKGLLILGILWWTWIGYAWLTSVVDPEEGVVRLLIISAMAALLVVSLCVPHAFGDRALLFACGIAFVRALHIGLFILGSRDDPGLRSSVIGLAGSTGLGCGLLIVGSLLGSWQAWVWLLALVLDMGGPKFFGLDGWRLVPGHYAERFGLIVLIALGESIVAIGVGAEGLELGASVIAGALLGVLISAALWWLYFDVVAVVAERRMRRAAPEEQTRMARDSYTLLHLPMVAGIVLLALGIKKTLGHVSAPLADVPAFALCGGVALYLLALVAFRLRNLGTLNRQRLVAAAVLLALWPVATSVDALVALALVAAILAVLVAYEALHFREARARVRTAS